MLPTQRKCRTGVWQLLRQSLVSVEDVAVERTSEWTLLECGNAWKCTVRRCACGARQSAAYRIAQFRAALESLESVLIGRSNVLAVPPTNSTPPSHVRLACSASALLTPPSTLL